MVVNHKSGLFGKKKTKKTHGIQPLGTHVRTHSTDAPNLLL